MAALRRALTSVGLMFLAAAGLTGCTETTQEAAGTSVVSVTVKKPVVRKVTSFEYFTGKTEAKESVQVRARVSGYLKEILFAEGKEVKKDAKLFVIDPRPYKAALDQAEGNVKAAEARLVRQDNDLLRLKKLRLERATSAEEYDKAVGDRAETAGSIFALKAAIEKAQLDLDFTVVLSPINGMVSRALVTTGNLVKADDTVLTTVVSTDPMYVNFNVDERIVLDVQESLRKGHFPSVVDAKIPVWVSLATDKGEYKKDPDGKLQFINNQINTGTGTLQVRAELPNPIPKDGGPRQFAPGLFVRVKVPISKDIERLLIPDRAIGSDMDQKFVYVVDDKNVIEKRPVKAGPLDKDLRVVLPVPMVKTDKGWRAAREGEKGEKESLGPSDRVVISGLQQIYPGVTVQVRDEKKDENGNGAQ
jgi:RND family efflux transporter MFP subunit